MAQTASMLALLFFAYLVQIESVQFPERWLPPRPNSVFQHPHPKPNDALQDPDPTAKRWLQEPPKVFFFAGIEGSGTKIFQDLWFDIFNDLEYDSSDDNAHHVLHFPDRWSCGTEWDYSAHKEMVAKMRMMRQNSIWSLPFQATYPSCGASEHLHEARQSQYHPNLSWIKHAADDAGVKLHVIFLQRDLKDCLALTCVQRHYEDCDNQSKTITQNAEVLINQIDNLDNDAVSCFKHYDEFQIQNDIISTFSLDSNAQTKMKNIFHERNNQSADAVTKFNVNNFNKANARLDQLCSTLSQFTLKDFKAIVDKTNKSNADVPIAEVELGETREYEEGPAGEPESVVEPPKEPENEEEEEKWEATVSSEAGPANEEEEEKWEALQEKKREEQGVEHEEAQDENGGAEDDDQNEEEQGEGGIQDDDQNAEEKEGGDGTEKHDQNEKEEQGQDDDQSEGEEEEAAQ